MPDLPDPFPVLAGAIYRLPQSRLLDRLEEVVRCPDVECADRYLASI